MAAFKTSDPLSVSVFAQCSISSGPSHFIFKISLLFSHISCIIPVFISNSLQPAH